MQRAIHPEEVDVTPLSRNPLRTLVCRQVVIAPEGGERARFLFFAAAPPRSIEGRHPSCATHFEPWLPAEGVIAGGGRAHPVALAAPMKGVERCRRALVAFSERYLVVWGRDGGAVAVARQWIRCGTLAGQPQNAVLRAGDLWLLLRNCKPNFVLAAGYRVRAASCAHRGLPALFASVRRTRGHKRLSACAHGMPSNLSRPSRELLSSLAAKKFCCCCCKK